MKNVATKKLDFYKRVFFWCSHFYWIFRETANVIFPIPNGTIYIFIHVGLEEILVAMKSSL